MASTAVSSPISPETRMKGSGQPAGAQHVAAPPGPRSRAGCSRTGSRPSRCVQRRLELAPRCRRARASHAAGRRARRCASDQLVVELGVFQVQHAQRRCGGAARCRQSMAPEPARQAPRRGGNMAREWPRLALNVCGVAAENGLQDRPQGLAPPRPGRQPLAAPARTARHHRTADADRKTPATRRRPQACRCWPPPTCRTT